MSLFHCCTVEMFTGTFIPDQIKVFIFIRIFAFISRKVCTNVSVMLSVNWVIL